ncbi:transmembrane and ubiquitin-like domain-containing protein 2 [Esox lucius]|uniref:Ubiquitin-like domain-containing protein n=1 Tax=Esox lucius TaxID=8010 RepID=A0AAY5K6X0_ESOLU|nr:transmembrane and ubiquitin-like domain-containing protein 2 [Esox lucius]
MAVCALTMDGLGDEVTAAGGVFLLILALVLAWLSTHVADQGDHILGTILTVGAHASLIGLGGNDSYNGGPPSADNPEQQTPTPTQENKPEEGEPGSERDGEGNGEGTAGAGVDLLLNIQGKKPHRYQPDDEDDDDDEEEEDDYEEEEKVQELSTKVSCTSITVRLKFLNDTEEVAVLRPQDTVGLLKSKYFSGRERQIKLIYQGQLLHDPKRTLLSLNISHNSVIHCHVSQVLQEASPEEAAGSGGGIRAAGLAMSTGSLVVPVFVVMLAVVWYFRINYRQFFTAPATISLVGVTVFFSFLIFGMHSR